MNSKVLGVDWNNNYIESALNKTVTVIYNLKLFKNKNKIDIQYH